jgi:acetoin utilization protein AcuB
MSDAETPPPATTVAAIMDVSLWTLTQDAGIASAIRLAQDYQIRHFLVIDNGTMTGIVSTKRLRAVRPGNRVGDVMSSPVFCIAPETTVDEALQIMSEQKVSCLPVIRGEFLLGSVTDNILRGEDQQVVHFDEPVRSQA